ncbi:MAG: hypothetical protein FWF85_07795 [Clostridiales bacterium]|jgi:hypothetical protein|nr:hypothetical protein [Clostridiales bacterium]MDR2713875.1 hypothetical protein [Clostridiales bacterium]
MDASLDTNVIIHLYQASFQSILFERFQRLFVYEYIRSQEVANNANLEVIAAFDEDLKNGNYELITNDYLKRIGMYPVFLQQVKEHRILFEGGDLGEVYAISLARTLGCMCLVTDDIKERGPHYTLMRIPDSDVIPLAFYEIIFLDYLQSRISEGELITRFNSICESSGLQFNLKSKLKFFIKRFWNDPYTDSEKSWMNSFCNSNSISAYMRMHALLKYINEKVRKP